MNDWRRSRLSAFLAFILFAAMETSGQTTIPATVVGSGTISGSVVDDHGTPVSGAIVALGLEFPSLVNGKVVNTGFKPFRALAVTTQDGRFSASNIPKGSIKICVQVSGSDFLETCQWPVIPQSVFSIDTGQTLRVPTISLTKGFRVKLRVEDSSGLLAKGAAAPTPAINLGVFSDNHLFVGARRVGADATGFDFDVLVPFNLPLHISASSKVLALADGNAKSSVSAAPVSSGTGPIVVPLSMASGAVAPAPIKILVTGVAAGSP